MKRRDFFNSIIGGCVSVVPFGKDGECVQPPNAKPGSLVFYYEAGNAEACHVACLAAQKYYPGCKMVLPERLVKVEKIPE